MTVELNDIARYFSVLGLVANAPLILLQIRAYRRTRHASLVVMAVATAFGLASLAVCRVADQRLAAGEDAISLYLVGAVLLTMQVVVGLWGLWRLLLAFENALSALAPNHSLQARRP